MTKASLLSIFLTSSALPLSQALKCGHWYSHACLGDTDKRYDPEYTNDIAEQNELWEKQSGFWRVTRESDQAMAPFDPVDLTGVVGLPYDDNKAINFVNITLSGSRRYVHNYVIWPPAPQSFCDEYELLGVPSFFLALGGGVCGVNGFASFVERYDVSSYEKDGSLHPVGNALGFALDNGFAPAGENGEAFPVGDRTIVFVSSSERPDGGKILNSNSFIFLGDTYDLARSISESYNENTAEVISSISFLYSKMSGEDEFVNAINEGWNNFAVQDDVVSRGGSVPMAKECQGTSCPTEEDWCSLDPNCSESPYQEPNGRVKSGVVAGFSVAAAVVVIALVCAMFLHRLKQQKQRIKLNFAARVAETIDLRASTNMALTPDALRKEFEMVDSSGDGFLSKEDLWAFMSSGKAGTMSEKDFGALFNALDIDKNGQVDFLEFCHFLTVCGQEFDHAIATAKSAFKGTKQERMMRASVSLASSNVRRSQMLGQVTIDFDSDDPDESA
eukprot:scaffold36212_cov53-Attheya_sp.AAC.2